MTAAIRLDHRVRFVWLLAALVVAFAFLLVKITDLQVINPERYREVGIEQRTFVQAIAADRGTIYDRNGVELAMSRPARSVFVDPTMIDDPRGSAAQLADALGMDPGEIEKRMTTEGRFAYVARKVPAELADRVEALGLPGVGLVEEPERFHPAGDMARSILGTTDVDNVGISGLEALYGDQLTGTPGKVVFERSPAGRTIALGEHHQVPAVKGRDLVLTLDRSLQYETERVLAEQISANKARSAIAIVSRPETGEILAMANMVADPETGDVVPGTNNAALTTVYEPGSVMKMVTVSAAIEAGLVSPDTMVQVPPTLKVGDATFQDAEPHGTVTWSVADVLAHSSNIGTIKIAQQLGKDRLHRALLAYGFGQPTSLGFPNEQSGRVPDPSDPDQWWATSIGTVPIGQGVSVTPLQMLLAYNTIANRGVYVPPSLVRSTIDADGNEHPLPVEEGHRVLSQPVADMMNVMLRRVVADGTGKLAQVHGYTPAGKTGTSRKPQPGGGYRDSNGVTQYQSTFVGFVPAERPALSIIVIIDEPRAGGYTGGVVAAPAWSKIASFALRELSIAPPATDAPAGGTPVGERSGLTPEGKVRGPTADLPVASPAGREVAVGAPR
ncbi:peptidoglycan D,D-transpeptidase FtsI family protein [Rhabdothermincola sediminis]|uniref:peptidoglycan D,D-transpeptidase FtsI family protein n=1 Tax=Rhabdothermincola sediminis TaxID=2751370 RepID=UPI001AA06948|nr:penicillin-binding protein 2 [Rhabdothermincola sediminis]